MGSYSSALVNSVRFNSKVFDFATRQPKQDDKGKLFQLGSVVHDLSGVNILHFGTDTIRQLYKGVVRADFLHSLDECLNNQDFFTLLDFPFTVSRMSKMSGYRYKLQNNALGLVLLIGSFYAPLDDNGTHLKIEVSPHLIVKKRSDTTNFLTRFASRILCKGWSPSAVALHLAVDFQGYEFPHDLIDNFVTRAKMIKTYSSCPVGELSYNDKIPLVAMVYGQRDSYTFGRADALQVCIYRKDLEIDRHDKRDFWEGVWGDKYNKNLPVWRVEVRFHHSVLCELAQGMGLGYNGLPTSYRWYKYTREIWDYALNCNRFEFSKGKLSPIWQLLRDDAPDNLRSKSAFVPCVRQKKTVSPSTARNISNFLGNSVSLYARSRVDFDDYMDFVRGSHIWPLIQKNIQTFGKSEQWFSDKMQKSYISRFTLGKAA